MSVQDLRVDSRYRLMRRLGQGSFGDVYQAHNINNHEDVAIKFERLKVDPSILEEEFRIYEALQGKPGIPQVIWYGYADEFRALVFELLGPSLEDLFNFCGRRFSLKTVLMIADQLIARFQHIHFKGVIHRDVKPENLLVGAGKRGNIIYITDLGIAWSECARTVKKPGTLMGTARYASIRGHQGEEQSAGDDLESLGYVLLYFLRGSLPWQGLKTPQTEDKCDRILAMKQSMTSGQLCDGLPQEFVLYFDYVRSLRLHDQPNYSHLRQTFSNLFRREGFEHDHVFNWTEKLYTMIYGDNPQVSTKNK